ncbi:hypothetical protein KJ660_03795 [Candidatus Micrarchaeota archaeon]|nr:hypothetical protein [Candidatus Micrarchaeota archaeon]
MDKRKAVWTFISLGVLFLILLFFIIIVPCVITLWQIIFAGLAIMFFVMGLMMGIEVKSKLIILVCLVGIVIAISLISGCRLSLPEGAI